MYHHASFFSTPHSFKISIIIIIKSVCCKFAHKRRQRIAWLWLLRVCVLFKWCGAPCQAAAGSRLHLNDKKDSLFLNKKLLIKNIKYVCSQQPILAVVPRLHTGVRYDVRGLQETRAFLPELDRSELLSSAHAEQMLSNSPYCTTENSLCVFSSAHTAHIRVAATLALPPAPCTEYRAA